jgi:hypothetical protein
MVEICPAHGSNQNYLLYTNALGRIDLVLLANPIHLKPAKKQTHDIHRKETHKFSSLLL